MTPFVQDYFNAERFESLFFMGVGVIAMAISLYFIFVMKKPFFYGMAISLIFVGLIQLVVGATIFVRSPKDITRVENILTKEPKRIQNEEVPRMKTVMKSFVTYRYVEISLAVLGLILYFVFASQNIFGSFSNELLKGLGLGLAIQAILMLGLDFFAEKRGSEYLENLIELEKNN
ncbi:hypothetical protein WAF17_13345 [Bernardetia sp. ABR2-2B]|uniref:hypothetical protein n=1 Tax=Bernardetia sp. ABR2-2B TaxID=3127472 RepID=UPI0030D29A46